MMETIQDPQRVGITSAETATTKAQESSEGVDMPSVETTPLFEPLTPDSATHPTSGEASGDEFGDFVDAPVSGTLSPPPMLGPLAPVAVQPEPESSTFTPSSPLDPLLSTGDLNPLVSDATIYKSLSPLAETLRPPLSSPLAGKEPKNNLVEDILKHEQGGMTLFSDPMFKEESEQLASPPQAPPAKPPPPLLPSSSRAATPTPSALTPVGPNFNIIPPAEITSHPSPLAVDTSSTTLSHPLASTSPSPSRLSPTLRPRTPPRLTTPQATKAAKSIEDETVIIAKHLGLIDHDYFTGREPAEASEIPIPDDLGGRSRSRSKLSASSGRSGSQNHRHHSHQQHEPMIGGIPSSPSQRRATLPPQIAPPVTSSGEEWEGVWGREGSSERDAELTHSGPLDLDTPGAKTASRPANPRRPSSYGTLTGLWGLWKGNTASPDDGVVEEPLDGHTPSSSFTEVHDHVAVTGPLTSSPPSIQPTIVEGRPLDTSAPEFEHHYPHHPNTTGGVHGHTGRPLPRARPSLESIQQKWRVDSSPASSHSPAGSSSVHSHHHSSSHLHPSSYSSDAPYSQSPSRSPSRTRVPIEPVTITHDSPFAPPPPPPNSSLFLGSGSLGAGFGGNPYSGPGSFRSSGGGTIKTANPFATHNFSQISGAPGFKPDEYDWDKGFSDELERELQGRSSPRQAQDKAPHTAGVKEQERYAVEPSPTSGERGRQAKRETSKRDVLKNGDGNGSGGSPTTASLYQTIGSKFGFGSWGISSSSSSSASSSPAGVTRAPAMIVPAASAPSSHLDRQLGRSGHARSATTPTFHGGKEEAIGELIEKKVGAVELKARKETTVGVLTQRIADLIRPHLPPLSRLPKSWTLLYSLDQHGISLNTLYTNCEAPEKQRKTGHQPYVGMRGAVVVLRDADADAEDLPAGKNTFGAFIADGLGRKAKGFYGGGDSFLWKYDAASDKVKVFKATGRNSYFAICDTDYIGFGGGSTSYGLWVNSSLLEGSSAPCPTFGNEVLCSNPSALEASTTSSNASASNGGLSSSSKLSLLSRSGSDLGKEVEFECVGLEVWGIGPG